MTDPITIKEFYDSVGADDWRVVSDGACAFYRTSSLAEAATFVQALSRVPGIDQPGIGIDLRQDGVTVRLLTPADDWYGPSGRDIELARQVSRTAQEQGLAADPSAIQSILVIPGAPDTAAVMPFWRAVLGYEPRIDSPDEDLVDPHDRGPAFWFEGMKEPRGDGGGAIHIAVWVPPEQAEARVAAALAAGGHMVRDTFAPSWWTLADAAGNEADIATTVNRE